MRVIVVGAGIAGLVAARTLAAEHDVTVLERRPRLGGRLATRRVDDAVLDAGAQFFTVRGAAFATQVDDWVERGVARVWCTGFHQRDDGYPRYVGSSGMETLVSDLARSLDVQLDRMVFTMRRRDAGWDVVIDDGTVVAADAVVLTCPVPQAWALLAESSVAFPPDLARSEYHRTVALLVVLDRPGSVPEPGGVQFDPADADNPFGFIGDNHAKGLSPVPAITFHATNKWSTTHWDLGTDEMRSALVAAARPWLGEARVVDAQVKKWRFAGPAEPWPDPCWVDTDRRVALAGDIFAGPKVEGAYHSGRAAAAAITALA